MKKYLTTITMVLLFSGFASSANATLIENGSFENIGLTSDASASLTTGSWDVFNEIAGWKTVSGPGIEIQNSVDGASYDGNQHVELDSHNNSSMKQIVNDTYSTNLYTLSFYYSPRPGQEATTNGITVSWNDTLLDFDDGSSILTGKTYDYKTHWTEYTFDVWGTGMSDTALVFSAVGTSDSLGGYIDMVSMTTAPVPEPATMLLFGVGLAGLAGARLRRKK